MSITFQISDKLFCANLNPLKGADFFDVRSVPKPYQVQFVSNERAEQTLQAALVEGPKNLLFIDQQVMELYGKNLDFPKDRIFCASATEKFKTFNGFLDVVDFMDRNQITKAEKMIVVGGGIIQDVGAFACAAYKRGIPWTFLPTTLLSQCDSCIGGKTGLNYKAAKNQLALFSAPSKVIINPDFLRTLTPDDIDSGMGEVLKLHITGGPKFLESFLVNFDSTHSLLNPDKVKNLILGALSVKKSVVEEDEFEQNYRRSMNYGHTVGHALETLSEYAIPHGIAVVLGILIVNELSVTYGMLSDAERNKVRNIALKLIRPKVKEIMKNLSLNDLMQLLKKDKKTTGNFVNFVMLQSIGDMKFVKKEMSSQLKNEIQQIIQEIFV